MRMLKIVLVIVFCYGFCNLAMLALDDDESAVQQYKDIEKLIKKNKFQEAEESIEELLKHNEQDYKAWELYADLYGQQKNKDEQFLALDKAYTILQEKESLSEEEEGDFKDFDAALNKLSPARKKAMALRKGHIKELLELAAVEIAAARFDNAKLAIKAILKLDRLNKDALALLEKCESGKQYTKDNVEPEGGKLFNGVSLKGWLVENGRWEVKDGQIKANSDDSDAPYILNFAKPVATDFSFELDLVLASGERWGSDAMIMLKTNQDRGAKFEFVVTDKSVALNFISAPGDPSVAVANKPFEDIFEFDQAYQVRIEKHGKTLKFSLAGKQLLSYDIKADFNSKSLQLSLGINKGSALFNPKTFK